MKRPSLRLLLASLALAVTAFAVPAQDPGASPGFDDDDPPGCACIGTGASCIFGNAAPCQVTACPLPCSCKCVGGGCLLGFPRSPQCDCNCPFPQSLDAAGVRPGTPGR